MPYDRPANPFYLENDSLILGTDAIPSPGFSRVRMSPLSFSTAIDLTRLRSSLVHAPPRGTLRSRLASRVSLSAPHHSSKAPPSYTCCQTPSGYLIRVRCIGLSTSLYYEGSNLICAIDGTERQIIKDMEGNNQRPKIKYCSICDPFVFILREDDTIGLFIGEPERGKIRRKDMSPMGEKVRYFGVPPFPGINRSVEDITLYRRLILHRLSWHIQNSCKRKCTCRKR
jgi:cleavage and polyadenylation specificity factor subunit 1